MSEREQEILNKTIHILRNHLSPQTIYLFGSRSKDTSRKGSDFDIAVSGKEPSLDIQQTINEALEKVLGLYQMDIVYLDSVDKNFKQLILAQGKKIYEK